MNEQSETIKDLKSYRQVRSIQSLRLKQGVKVNRVHIILDLYECDDKFLAKATLLEQKVKKVLNQFELEPKIETFYQFQPFGVTAIICTKDLQFTMHTWPEYKSAAIDFYCFASRKKATQVCDALRLAFKSNEYEMKVRKR